VHNSGKVLLIEDERVNALGVGRVLKELFPAIGFEVVSTGEQAIEWIHRFRHNETRVFLILMDMTLQRMEGLKLLPEIKSNPHLTHTPVVIFSGNESPKAIEHAYQSGACAYIFKKTDATQMKRTLANIFNFWLDTNVLFPRPTEA
jgi:two-component system response regulator